MARYLLMVISCFFYTIGLGVSIFEGILNYTYMETVMFDELCNERTLLQAWKTVKSKGSSGGVDGMSIVEMDRDIASILKLYSSNLYLVNGTLNHT